MGMHDRDWWRDAHNEREKRAKLAAALKGAPSGRLGSGMKGLRWGPFWIVVFWTVIMGGLYLGMNHYLKPKAQVVTASGDLVVTRARDGHFYGIGSVNGRPAKFLVDTGASFVTVSESFAREAGIANGEPAVFRTANGEMPGRIVSAISVTMGPLGVSNVKVAVGLVGHDVADVLLGQSFLSKFEIILQKDQMVIRKR